VVDPETGVGERQVWVRGERIAGLLAADAPPPPGARVLDAGGLHLFPGLVEPHAHLGYGGADMPGQFETETASALRGGFTTVLNVHRHYGRGAAPYDDLGETLRACRARSRTDFAIHLALLREDHVESIERHAAEAGVRSFKLYLAYRGADGRQIGMTNEIDDGLLVEALRRIAGLPGAVACFHCENTEIVNRLAARLRGAGRQGLGAFAESRPPYAEVESLHRAITLAGVAGCPAYVLHLGSRDGLAEVERLRAAGALVFVETGPHYLTLTAEAPPGTLAKVNPPVRTAADLEATWAAVERGVVDTVGTDHCAMPRARKGEDVWAAAPGFPGLATALPLLLTEGHLRRGVSLQRVAQLMALNPARVFGLAPRKGTLRPGADADLVLVDLATPRRVEVARLGSAADFSPWEGWTLRGWPVLTLARGAVAMEEDRVTAAPGRGRYLGRDGT
jgi:dihydropyrimidinase